MINEDLNKALENQDLFSQNENASENNPDASKESLNDITNKLKEEYSELQEEEKAKEDVTEDETFQDVDQFGLKAKEAKIEEKEPSEKNIQFVEAEEVTDGVKKDEKGNITKIDFTKLDVDQVISAEVKVLTFNPNLIPEKLKSIEEILAKEEITEKKDKDAVYSVRMDLRTARLDLKKETEFSISKWNKIARGVKETSEKIQSSLSEEEARLKTKEDQFEAYKEAENKRKEEERQIALKKRVDELTEAGLYFDDESSMYVCGLVAIDMVTIEKNSEKKHKELLSKIEEQFIAEEEKRKAVEQAKKDAEEAQAEADRKAKEAEEKAQKEAEEAKKANLQMRSMLMTANQLIQVEEQFQYNGKDIISVEEVSSASNEEFMKFVGEWMTKKIELDKEEEERKVLEAEERLFYSRLQRMKDIGFKLEDNSLFYENNYSKVLGDFKEIKSDEDFESFYQERKNLVHRAKKQEEAVLSNRNYLLSLGFKEQEDQLIFEKDNVKRCILFEASEIENNFDLFTKEQKMTFITDVEKIKVEHDEEEERKSIEANKKALKAKKEFESDIKELTNYVEQLKSIQLPEFKTEELNTLINNFFLEVENIITLNN